MKGWTAFPKKLEERPTSKYWVYLFDEEKRRKEKKRKEDPELQQKENYSSLIATAVIKYSAYYKKIETTFRESRYYSVSLAPHSIFSLPDSQ